MWLVLVVLGFIAGFLVGWAGQKRGLADMQRTTLAVLAAVAEILEKVTNILDRITEEIPPDALAAEGEDAAEILKTLNHILEEKGGKKLLSNGGGK